MIMNLINRYYAGDQEGLFEEAHLIHPRQRVPNPKPILKVSSRSYY